MNSTIQVLRAIPELQTALNECALALRVTVVSYSLIRFCRYKNDNAASQNDAVLVQSLRDLYRDMGKTSEGIPPVVFLNVRLHLHMRLRYLLKFSFGNSTCANMHLNSPNAHARTGSTRSRTRRRRGGASSRP